MVCTVLESTWLRSLVKGITWETTGLITVAGIALLFTGDLRQSLLIGAVYLPVRVGMYFVHERQARFPKLMCHTLLIGYLIQERRPDIEVVFADGRDKPVWKSLVD